MHAQKSNSLRNFIIGAIIICGAVSISYYAKKNPPVATRDKPPIPELHVEVVNAKARDYTVIVESYGTIQARTRGTITTQVNGEIIDVSNSFREGNFFEQGDVLLEIDPRDYQTAVINASANVSQANAALSQEQALANQAAKDWRRLGNKDTAPDLVLRKPQLAASQAQLQSNTAALDKAQLDLTRTKITAPYAGRVITKNVDVGQYVSIGTQLAEIFAIDYVEVRLPLTSREYAQIDINENYRGENITLDAKNSPTVLINSNIGEQHFQYNGFISRSEGVFDPSTRQTYVVVHVDDPYGKKSKDQPPLKLGQFVTAQIRGKVIDGVFVIPNSAVYQGNYLFVVENDIIKRREVNVAWQDTDNSIIKTGIENNEIIVLTPLNETISGTKVRFDPS